MEKEKICNLKSVISNLKFQQFAPFLQYNKTEWDDQLSQHATTRVNILLADDSDYVKKWHP